MNVEVWKGEITTFASLQKVWMKIRKINPKCCEWAILDQITSVFGTLMEVDWQSAFNSFFEVVRVKLSYRDDSKIPKKRTFGISGKFYKLLFEVEPLGRMELDDENRTDNNEGLHIGEHDIQSDAGTCQRT